MHQTKPLHQGTQGGHFDAKCRGQLHAKCGGQFGRIIQFISFKMKDYYKIINSIFWFFLYIFILFQNNSFSQSIRPEIIDTLGMRASFSIDTTLDGGYIFSGLSMHPFDNDGFAIKTDSLGNISWARNYNLTSQEGYYAVNTLLDSSYLLAGLFAYNNSTRCWLTRISNNGDTIWNTSFPTTSLDLQINGWSCFNFKYPLISAVGNAVDSGIRCGWLALATTVGTQFQFVKHKDSRGSIDYACASSSFDGGYILGGSIQTSANGLNPSFYLVRTNFFGDTIWTKILNSSGFDHIVSVTATLDSGFVFCGWMDANTLQHHNCAVVKVSKDGIVNWIKYLPWSNENYVQRVRLSHNNGLVIGGSMSDTNNNTVAYILKTDNNGNKEWDKLFLIDSCGAEIYDIQITRNGGYAVTGIAYTPTGTKPFIAVLDSSGTLTNYKTIVENDLSLTIMPNPSDDQTSVKLNGNNYVHIAKYTLYNSNGIAVWHKTGPIDITSIDTRLYTSGIYILTIEIDKTIILGKIMVAH